MRWGIVLVVTVVMALIVWFEWPRMHKNPKKDKIAFFALISIGWVMAMFDLPNMAGPNTWLEFLFKPFRKIMEK